MISANPGGGGVVSTLRPDGSVRRDFASISTSRLTGSWVGKSLGPRFSAELQNYPRARSTRQEEIIPPGGER